MSTIHAIGDIHGFIDLFDAHLRAIDLDGSPDTCLVLLGDYIDRGPASAECLNRAKELSDRFGDRVVVLLGNHEADFLEWLDGDAEDFEWLLADAGFTTVRTFVPESLIHMVGAQLATSMDFHTVASVNGAIQQEIRQSHRELIDWLRQRPLVYETEKQIFVHAGIDEEAGTDWRLHTPDHMLLGKYPATFGPFHKTIIAGHVATSPMHPDGSSRPYFDGESHWYLDGSVEHTGRLNLLTYDTLGENYSDATSS